MTDSILALLEIAVKLAHEEKRKQEMLINGQNHTLIYARDIAITLTHIETAVLWRKRFLEIPSPEELGIKTME